MPLILTSLERERGECQLLRHGNRGIYIDVASRPVGIKGRGVELCKVGLLVHGWKRRGVVAGVRLHSLLNAVHALVVKAVVHIEDWSGRRGYDGTIDGERRVH